MGVLTDGLVRVRVTCTVGYGRDGPVRVGINWDGRALPVLADGEKMSKNAVMGGVLAVLAALFVAARNPANQATVTDWLFNWGCNPNSSNCILRISSYLRTED